MAFLYLSICTDGGIQTTSFASRIHRGDSDKVSLDGCCRAGEAATDWHLKAFVQHSKMD
jgi:hypothetical protein